MQDEQGESVSQSVILNANHTQVAVSRLHDSTFLRHGPGLQRDGGGRRRGHVEPKAGLVPVK